VSLSFRSTPPTWLSTVLIEMCSSRAISLYSVPASDVAEHLLLAGDAEPETPVD
jgi:hypothetical protein